MGALVRLAAGIQLDLNQLASLGRFDTRVEVEESVEVLLASRRQVLERHMADGKRPIYGATTGLGPMKIHTVMPSQASQFNARMVRDHAAGFGPELDTMTARLMMGIRIVELSRGGSGISLGTFSALVALYNQGIVPVVPRFGSMGEADITILAHLAQAMQGEGAVRVGGKLLKAGTALQRAGLGVTHFGARDGLAVIGGNSYTVAVTIGALMAWQAARYTVMPIMALSWVAWQANSSALREDVLGGERSSTRVAEQLRVWLGDTAIVAQSIQDPLSWRCIPQVHGAMDRVATELEERLLPLVHVGRDNPLVLESDVVSNGNFDITDLVLALDALRNALWRVMTLTAARIAKMLNHRYSGLPSGLAMVDGDPGLGLLEFDAAAVLAEAEPMATSPVSQRIEVAGGLEDYGTMAPVSAYRLRQLIDFWQFLQAAELLCCARTVRLKNLAVGKTLAPWLALASETGHGNVSLHQRMQRIMARLTNTEETPNASRW